jgi:hypothetical protein
MVSLKWLRKNATDMSQARYSFSVPKNYKLFTYNNIVQKDEATNNEWLANFYTIYTSINIDSIRAKCWKASYVTIV